LFFSFTLTTCAQSSKTITVDLGDVLRELRSLADETDGEIRDRLIALREKVARLKKTETTDKSFDLPAPADVRGQETTEHSDNGAPTSDRPRRTGRRTHPRDELPGPVAVNRVPRPEPREFGKFAVDPALSLDATEEEQAETYRELAKEIRRMIDSKGDLKQIRKDVDLLHDDGEITDDQHTKLVGLITNANDDTTADSVRALEVKIRKAIDDDQELFGLREEIENLYDIGKISGEQRQALLTPIEEADASAKAESKEADAKSRMEAEQSKARKFIDEVERACAGAEEATVEQNRTLLLRLKKYRSNYLAQNKKQELSDSAWNLVKDVLDDKIKYIEDLLEDSK
jgi:hypothetical protein